MSILELLSAYHYSIAYKRHCRPNRTFYLHVEPIIGRYLLSSVDFTIWLVVTSSSVNAGCSYV